MSHVTQHLIFWGALYHFVLQAALEDQQDSKTKTDRFGLSWWDGDPWIAEPQPPAPVGPPQRPQIARPPAPLDQPRPPAPLVQPPAPIQNHLGTQDDGHVTRGGVHAEDIHCVRANGVTLLSALVIPPPEFVASPVFEDATPHADCGMRPSQGGSKSSFAMHVQHFSRCGVRVQQGSDGKEWISVTLRFPYMEGLRMAEDEYVMIMCKPQERTATTHHVMDMRGTATEGRSVQTKKVFRSGQRDVACRMALMTRSPGSQTGFGKEMKSGSVVSVGQELQLRGVVKEGDGWNFAMLKDVIVSRVSSKTTGAPRKLSAQEALEFQNNVDIGEAAFYNDNRSPQLTVRDEITQHDLAHLVKGDGCRNPMFRLLAPQHPQRDPHSPLVVSFAFKAFMFQDMRDGEFLRLSAQVVACAELSDCQLSFCNGDGQRSFSKRPKRSSVFNNSTGVDQRTANFTEDFELAVSLEGFSKTPFVSLSPEKISQASFTDDCKIIVISVFVASFLFCLLTTIMAAVAIAKKRKSVVAPSREEKRQKMKLRK